MIINRDIVLAQLTSYLKGQLTAPEAYRWALGAAVCDDYVQLARQDPLAAEAVKILMNIERIEMHPIGPHQALEYYRRCLAGELEAIPLDKREDFSRLGIPPDPRDAGRGAQKKEEVPASQRLWDLARGYVFFFGLAICGIFAASLVHPDFLNLSGEESGAAGAQLTEVVPQMIYAFTLMLPLGWTARGMFFYLVFCIEVLGAVYYWYVPVKMVLNYAPHLVLILVALPFSALPATLALVLLIRQREIKK